MSDDGSGATRQCPNGHDVAEGKAFCTTCGAEVGADPGVGGAEGPSRPRRAAAVVAAIVVLFVVVAGAAFALGSQTSDDDERAGETSVPEAAEASSTSTSLATTTTRAEDDETSSSAPPTTRSGPATTTIVVPPTQAVAAFGACPGTDATFTPAWPVMCLLMLWQGQDFDSMGPFATDEVIAEMRGYDPTGASEGLVNVEPQCTGDDQTASCSISNYYFEFEFNVAADTDYGARVVGIDFAFDGTGI